ncbi:MAG: hypothetical protein JXR63_09820 [Spirochaetales bacterium]|nr:hypothetical protein [Spirochaetales bacterium]
MKSKIKILTVFVILVMLLGACNKFGVLFKPLVTSDTPLTNITNPKWIWSKVPGATGYDVKIGENGNWIDVGEALEFTLPEDLFIGSGTYTLFVRARNENGDFSEIQSFSVVIDLNGLARPVVTSYIEKTNSQFPTWEWGEVENADFYQYSFSVDGPWTTLNAGVLSLQLEQPLAEGTYSFYLQASNKVGNFSEISEPVTTIIDLSSFNPPSVYPSSQGLDVYDGELLLRRKINLPRPTWSWQMDISQEEEADLRAYRYQLNGQREDKWIVLTTGVSSLGSYSIDRDLPEGLHTLYVQAGKIVSEGEYNWTSSGSFTYEIDFTPPDSPDVFGVEATMSIPEWSWTVASGVEYVKFGIVSGEYVEGATIGWVRWKDSNDEWFDVWSSDTLSYKPESSYPPGVYSLVVVAGDDVYNWSEVGYFSTEIFSLSLEVPVVSVVDSSPTNNANPTWTWESSIDLSAYRYQLDGQDVGQWTVVSPSVEQFSPVFPLTSGVRTLYVQSLPEGFDPLTAGEEYWSDSGFAQIEVDLIPPEATNVVGSSITGNRRPSWSWDIPSTTVSFRFKIVSATPSGGGGFDLGQGFWVEAPASVTQYTPSSDLEVSFVNQELNYYAFVIQAVDNVGNWSESSMFVTQIRTDVPSSPVVNGVALTVDPRPTWTWSASGSNGYRYQLDGQSSGGWIETLDTDYTPDFDLSDGSHTLYVQVKNEFDIWSGSGFYMSVIDTTGPTAPTVGGPAISGLKRPTWVWNLPAETEGFRYQLDGEEASSWIEVEMSVQSYTPDFDLIGESEESGSATLYVQGKDNLGNWSTSGSYEILINTAGASAPVVSGETPTNNEYPQWTWDAIPDAIKYRYSLNNPSGPWAETTSTSYTSVVPLQGYNTLYVQVLTSISPVWSESGSFEIYINTVPPAVPVVLSKGPKTGDATPSWWWENVDGATQYRYRLGSSGSWIVVQSSQPRLFTAEPLSEGVYALFVQAGDEIGNWSNSGSYSVEVDFSSPNLGIPGKVTLVDVSKGHFSNAVRIEWESILDADSYNIYKITQGQLDGGELVGTVIPFDSDYYGENASENCFYYDLVGEGNFYYRVSAVNSDGEGLKSDFSTASEKQFARGNVIESIKSSQLSGDVSRTGWFVQWSDISDADRYLVYRSNVDSSDLSDFNLVEAATTLSYTDTTSGSNPESDTNYYKVVAVNSVVVDDNLDLQGEYVKYGAELVSSVALGDVVVGYSVSATAGLAKSVFPVVTFSPTENSVSYINKIHVSGSVSNVDDLDRINLILVRSCQHGDDPDVNPLAEPKIDYGNSSWTPLGTAITTFTKEIDLSGYIDGSGNISYLDPMPVYEYNPSSGQIEEIAGESLLWNYKRWDREAWKDIKRKQNFDMNRAVKVSYRIKMERKLDPTWDSSLSAVKTGYPALGTEEFAHLAMFLKDCAFNRIWHMQVPRYNWGRSQAWLAETQSYSGENGGNASYSRVGVAGGAGGFDGYSDWPGFAVSTRNRSGDWAGISVTPDIFAQNSEEHISFWLAITTPLYNGHVYVDNLAARDYIIQWGVYNTAGNKGSINVYYNDFNGTAVPALNILFEYSPAAWNTIYSTQKAGYKDYDKQGFHTGNPDQVSTPLTKINFRYHPDPWGQYGNWDQYGSGWNLYYGLE